MTAPSRFLERWSRLKRQAEEPSALGVGGTPLSDELPAATGTPAPDESGAQAADGAGETRPSRGEPAADALPPVETLSLDADFTGFLKKEVGEPLRRAALRKLFSDPHFNRMDGLDVYIDDYNVADPIPPEVMSRLRQFQTFLGDEPEQRGPDAAAADLRCADDSCSVSGSAPDAGGGRTAEVAARAAGRPARAQDAADAAAFAPPSVSRPETGPPES